MKNMNQTCCLLVIQERVFRKILKDLLPTEHNLSVYGADWGGLIDKNI